ncbi:MAG: hypothetical protein CFH21_01089 [Alphaproteobacteria bacterium MarineAlpha5_Bin11]|nr:glutamyl-tRNA amidotransferase [Pelagibacteraceae bacterium]PPR42523.1 MAG: hypothetical protein CFH21_01089 [Alphaproteobacteria bacterium MarineAlpha5_Bin11]PPR51664.1 MAG: hypothetical protein CFH20_00450 [Alphaproteobacteria bacterium MarineAlpha5_Bin10]|tara:strand:- start:3448 stop:3909 length:462 start_codon:yes stop_codon:yes gene_type:complete
MSNLRTKIEEKYIDALKAKDEISIKTLRLIKSAIKDKDILERDGDASKLLSDQGIISLLQTLIKQRKESIEMFKKGNRQNLVNSELKEIEIIQLFLPEQMSEAETKKQVEKVIKDLNLSSIKEMGKLMAELRKQFSGKLDFSIAGKIAKEFLK